MLLQRRRRERAGVEQHRRQVRRRNLRLEDQLVLVGALAHAELLERDLAGDRLVPALHHALEVPGEVPGMSRVRAVAEGRHPVVGGDRVAVIPHQRRIELEGPDRAVFVPAPLQRGGRDDLEVPAEPDQGIGKDIGRAVREPLVDRLIEIRRLVEIRLVRHDVDLLIGGSGVIGQRDVLGTRSQRPSDRAGGRARRAPPARRSRACHPAASDAAAADP